MGDSLWIGAQHFDRVIDQRLAQLLQILRGAGVEFWIVGGRSIGGEQFGNVQQMRGVGEGGDDRDAGVGTEECVAGLEGEMGEAEGSQIVGIGHGFTYRWLGGAKG